MSDSEEKVELNDEDMQVINDLNESRSPSTKAGGDEQVSATPVVAGSQDDADESMEFTAEHTAQAQQYGLDIKQFESPEQLERKILDVDRRWSEYATMQRYIQAQQHQQPYQPQGQQPAPQAQVQPQVNPPEPQIPFKLDLSTEEYPPELIEKMNATLQQIHNYYQPLQQQVEQVQQFVAQQQQAMEQQRQQQVFDEFHNSVQVLGHKQLFGESPETLTQEQALNMRKLYDHASALADGYLFRGMPVPPMNELVRRAEKLAFEQELEAYKAQTRNARLTKQAKQRLGGGQRTASMQPEAAWDGDLVNNPKLKEAWNNIMTELGER